MLCSGQLSAAVAVRIFVLLAELAANLHIAQDDRGGRCTTLRGSSCVFPVTFEGIEYTECFSPSADFRQREGVREQHKICATQVDSKGELDAAAAKGGYGATWGICKPWLSACQAPGDNEALSREGSAACSEDCKDDDTACCNDDDFDTATSACEAPPERNLDSLKDALIAVGSAEKASRRAGKRLAAVEAKLGEEANGTDSSEQPSRLSGDARRDEAYTAGAYEASTKELLTRTAAVEKMSQEMAARAKVRKGKGRRHTGLHPKTALSGPVAMKGKGRARKQTHEKTLKR
jgi:hypothetical protein